MDDTTDTLAVDTPAPAPVETPAPAEAVVSEKLPDPVPEEKKLPPADETEKVAEADGIEKTPVEADADGVATLGDTNGEAPEASPEPVEAAADAEAAPASIAIPVQNAGKVSDTFSHGADYEFASDESTPIIENVEDTEKLAEGAFFYAAFVHDPRKSGSHYEILNIIEDLIRGVVQRRGVSPDYWLNHSAGRPPVFQRIKGGIKYYA